MSKIRRYKVSKMHPCTSACKSSDVENLEKEKEDLEKELDNYKKLLIGAMKIADEINSVHSGGPIEWGNFDIMSDYLKENDN